MKLDIVCSQVAKKPGKHRPTTHTSSFVSAYQTGSTSGKLLLKTSNDRSPEYSRPATSVNGADKRKTLVSGYHTGQHSKIGICQ